MSTRKFMPGIAWFFIVLLLICLPGNDLPEPESWMEKIYLEKWVHMGMFGMLALLFMWPVGKSVFSPTLKWQYFIKIALASSIWGLATEFIQKFFIPGRSFDIMDWAADSIGILAAIILARRKLL
ncbi:MAG TPA: VanZ family protein [Ferruginibacter sp.]|nr:VanZ family protein [Ferruginibacter sp.]